MKQITDACICQTLKFTTKENMERGEAIKLMLQEAKDYKEFLSRIEIPYTVVEEKIADDAAVILEIKKKYGRYDMGKYLEQ